jgi:GNAT superfamily N-acetyltransferase
MEYLALSDLRPEQRETVRAIYEEAFPSWQREPFDALVRAFPDEARLQLAMIDGRDVVGFATTLRLQAVSWRFLEYFAVTERRRNQGLGGSLWQTLIERLAEGGPLPIVLEVERPQDAPAGTTERTTRERRIDFYRRRGAYELAIPDYRVPHLTGEGSDALLLLAVPVHGSTLPTGAELEALVRSLYVEGYGLRPDDPLVRSALASLGPNTRA